ncbi:MAG TPA: GEVED domain-containing protein, partial [Flavobacteriales bacterium]|nr:GEVED domain-containing protein [Flavobacteriales bacterium]
MRADRGGDVSGNTYCHPSFLNDGSSEHFIDGVVLEGISNSNTGFTSDANGWNDRFFDGYGTVTRLTLGGSYSLSITGGPMDDLYYAWIDLDHDGSYEEVELVGSVQTGSPNETVTIDFTVPGETSIGYTGLRIICIDYYDPAPDPCGGYAYGEAEDFAVLIASDFPCAPINSEGTTQGDFISAIQVGPYSGA